MSIHRSLKSKAALKRSRNVLTRKERIEALKSDEKWVEGRSVFGLPSVRVKSTKPKAPPKVEKAEATAEEGAEAKSE